MTSTAKQLGGRAVHIKIYPRPRNISESRQILRHLEGFGEVVMYKHLKHEPQAPSPNIALAIFQNQNAVEKLMSSNPIRFMIEVPKSKPPQRVSAASTDERSEPFTFKADEDNEISSALKREHTSNVPGTEELTGFGKQGDMAYPDAETYENGALAASTDSSISLRQPAKLPVPPDSFSPSPASPLENREFQLTISPSMLNHKAYIERQAYYGGFKLNLRTVMAEDLEGRVPMKGLMDCRLGKGEVPLRMRMKRAKNKDTWMGLKGMWEEGQRKEASLEGSNDRV